MSYNCETGLSCSLDEFNQLSVIIDKNVKNKYRLRNCVDIVDGLR